MAKFIITDKWLQETRECTSLGIRERMNMAKLVALGAIKNSTWLLKKHFMFQNGRPAPKSLAEKAPK